MTTVAAIEPRTKIVGTNHTDVQISANPWNQPRIVTGGASGGVFVRDTAQADGWGLVDAVATGSVLVSAGVGTPPVWTTSPTLTGLAVTNDIYEKQRTTPMGHWISVPFNAANFYPATGTWTVTAGQVTRNRYMLIGKSMCWQLTIAGSSLSAANSYVYVGPPVSCPGSTGATRTASCISAGTPLLGVEVFIDPGSGMLLVRCLPGTPSLAAGTLDVAFTSWLEIN
jgi:hypothetical protein